VLLRAIPQGWGARDFLRDAVPAILERAKAQLGPPTKSYLGHFPTRAPFAFAPLEELLLPCAFASSRAWPHDDLSTRLRRLVAQGVGVVLDLPLIQPLVTACDGDMIGYFRLTSRLGHTMFFSDGQSWYEFPSERCAVCVMEGTPLRALAALMTGFYAGFSEAAVGHRADVSVSITSPLPGTLTHESGVLSPRVRR